MKTKKLFLAITLTGICVFAIGNGWGLAQNVSINTTGAAAAATNFLEVLQPSTTASSVGIYSLHSGVITGTGYAGYFSKTGASTTNVGGYFSATGATNNYACIFENGSVGIGTTAPTSMLHTVASGAKTTGYSGTNLTNTATSSTGSINKYGLTIQSTGTWNGANANNIGLYISSVTGGTNNYDAVFNGGGNVGIGTSAPATTLDVNGAVANREGTALSLVNGNNNDVAPGNASFFRITGPTAAYTITGISGGVDGKIIKLINTTSQSFTIAYESISSTAGNRVYTPALNDAVFPNQYATITLQYNSSLSRWIVISTESGGGYWTRPTGQPYISDVFNTSARVYDAGQSYGFFYEATNTNGSFFSGANSGVSASRNGQAATDLPTFGGDVYPFVDAGANGDITSADGLTYSGVYGYGGVYNGVTGIGALDAGVRGIGLSSGTQGTNASWPVVGVMGEVINTGSGNYGQQGVFGWQALAAGANSYCIGTYGVTSQTGTMSGGVVGQYFATVDDPNDGFVATGSTSAANYWGALGYGNTPAGVYGYGRSTSAQAIALKADVSCALGNPSYSYGGYFSSSGTQDARTVYADYSGGVTNYAGYFVGNHYISGTKTTAFLNQEGKPVLMYCVEMPEIWFEDVGSATIQNGQSEVLIPQDIIVGIKVDDNNPIKVFITPTSPMGSYWVEKTNDGFTLHVEDASDGATFDWRIMAKRRGYENRRLDYAGADASVDPFLVDPYSNPSNDSRINWKDDMKLKAGAVEELRLHYESLKTPPKTDLRQSEPIDKTLLENNKNNK